MYCSIKSATINGLTSQPIDVQISATTGLPQETIIGLPDTVVKESRSRIKSALQLSGFTLPSMAYTINLSPVDVQKKSNSIELAIAVGLLSITQQINVDLDLCFLGALSLDGVIEPVRHMLPLIHYYNTPSTTFVIPQDNVKDIQFLDGVQYIPIGHLKDFCNLSHRVTVLDQSSPLSNHYFESESYDYVHGHSIAKQACAISIAGHHPLLFIGAPGIGKTMLIDRLPTLTPPLKKPQIIENLCIQSLLNQPLSLCNTPPFRTPHHTISYAGMIGGQNPPKPGEITRANHGILFLDELGEYNRSILETLREPLETQYIQISRAGHSVTFPANFLLVSAMNPCFCGFLFNEQHPCTCNTAKVTQYWHKISKPLLDRFPICMILKKPNIIDPSMPSVTHTDLLTMVANATSIQQQRNPNGCTNHHLSNQDCLDICNFDSGSLAMIDQWISKQGLSFRARFRLIKLSLTIADCAKSPIIRNQDISFAIQLSNHSLLP